MGSSASSSRKKLPPLLALQDRIVDADNMMGLWYVNASIPTPFEKGAFNATEFYQWKVKDKKNKQEQESKGDEGREFTVTFSFNHNSFDGKRKELYQKGKDNLQHVFVSYVCSVFCFIICVLFRCIFLTLGRVFSANGAEWRVRPKLFGVYLPIELPFLISEVADDYSWVIIGYPSRKYLWIMTRKQIVKAELASSLKVCLALIRNFTIAASWIYISWPRQPHFTKVNVLHTVLLAVFF